MEGKNSKINYNQLVSILIHKDFSQVPRILSLAPRIERDKVIIGNEKGKVILDLFSDEIKVKINGITYENNSHGPRAYNSAGDIKLDEKNRQYLELIFTEIKERLNPVIEQVKARKNQQEAWEHFYPLI